VELFLFLSRLCACMLMRCLLSATAVPVTYKVVAKSSCSFAFVRLATMMYLGMTRFNYDNVSSSL